MKIDRRSFLALVAGGAVGTALTPLPLKLTDDLSIWTQSFRYMPNEVPVPPDGAVSREPSVCKLCPGGCGISVRKIGDRAVKIEGQEGYPVNDGGICTLGLAGLQLLYGPWRVKSPLKKENGKFVPVSWDLALADIAGKLNDLRNNGKAATVAGVTGDGKNTVGRLLQRLLTVIGSPNFVSLPSSEDAVALAARKMTGTSGVPAFDFENSTYVLSFSAGILDGWGSPVRMFQANSRWKEKGVKLVQVESRLSNTAAKADAWVPIKPGTEAVLALGLANIILREGLQAADVETDSTAFAAFRKLLNDKYGPDEVAKITGVDQPKLEKLARGFAKAARPVAVCGNGSGLDPVSSCEAMAVLALNALVGGINRTGGVRLAPAPDYINWPAPEPDAVAEKALTTPRLDGAGTAEFQDAASLPHRLIQKINSTPQSPVQALFVCEANPVFTLHDSQAVRNAFEKIPLVVSLSAYLDETAAAADYILPLHNYLERYEDVPVTAGLAKPMVGLARPVVKPVFDTRHPGDVLIALAKAMGGVVAGAFSWETYEDCLKQTLGDNWGAISAKGYLMPSALAAMTESMAPAGQLDFSSLIRLAQDKPQVPDLALIPYDSIRLRGGRVGTPPFVLKTVSDSVLKKTDSKNFDVFVEINPVTARRCKVADGQTVMLETAAGKARVRIHETEGIANDVIAMPRGLGHSAYDDYLADKGVNINSLVAPVEDPISGFDVAWDIKAKLSKA